MDIEAISLALNDKETTLKMANAIIDNRVQELQETSLVKEMFRVWGRHIVEKNVEEIFNHAQSPIEKIFLNSVHFFSLMRDTRMLVFTPRDVSIQEQIEKHQALKEGMRTLKESLRENNPTKSDEEIENEALNAIKQGGEEDFYNLVFHHHMLYEVFGLKNSFHVTLQTFIEGVRIGNRRVKPDITIWLPEKAEFKLVVECDGFKFHSDKETFTRDRQKDRELQKVGYKTHRYSGTEIYNKPVETGFDLCEYLFLEYEKMLE